MDGGGPGDGGIGFPTLVVVGAAACSTWTSICSMAMSVESLIEQAAA